MDSRAQLAPRVEALMMVENERYLAEVPRATHLTDSQPLDDAYYVRHRIETIKRIRMTARTDALSLAAMVSDDYDAARIWSHYICEELDHDRMFYDDLARHGLARARVDEMPPFEATQALGAYLEHRIAEDGAMAAVAYSLFVEWNSQRFSRSAAEKAGAAYGPGHVKGALSHLVIDEAEDHYEMMLDIAERLTRRAGAEQALLRDISEIADLFRRYFRQLHEYSVAARLEAA